MSNIQYSLLGQDKTPSSERLLYMSSSVYEKDWKSIFHSHSFTELFYIVSGEGELCLEEKKIPIKENHLIIINPHIKHTETSSSHNQLKYIVLGIDNLKFQFAEEVNYCIHDCKTHQSVFVPLLQSMLNELRKKNMLYEEVLDHYLAIFFLIIKRVMNCDVTIAPSKNLSTECENVKLYIDSHYQNTITLDSLAAIAHWDKYYFSHMFTKEYGISPINYLLERRILQSKQLLKSTDYSVTQVAQSTGFSSQNYFSQAFKKSTGVTPNQYRKHHQNINDSGDESPL